MCLIIENQLIHSTVKENLYKIIRVIKFIFVILYSMTVFFEKPLHCYKQLTFFPVANKDNNECPQNLQFMNKDIFSFPIAHRCSEIFFLLCFIFIQHILTEERKTLKRYTYSYSILQKSIIILISICIIDIICGIIFKYFPIFNFFLRGIVIILLVRNLRSLWLSVVYLFYSTWKVFFLMFCVIFCFGILGYFLFEYSDDFSSIYQSMFSLYILLTTCNFPDVMLNTFTMKNKRSILFFIMYIVINYFIIFSLLKSLYYSSFFEIFKDNAKKVIKEIVFGSNEQNTSTTSFEKKLRKINKKYQLSDEEIELILDMITDTPKRKRREALFANSNSDNNSNDDISSINSLSIERLRNMSMRSKKMEISNISENSKILKLLNKKQIEGVIVFVDLVVIMVLFSKFQFTNKLVLIIQLIWCLLCCCEFILYIYNSNLYTVLTLETVISIFNIVNIFTIFLFLFGLILPSSRYQTLITLMKPIIITRVIRVVQLFSKIKAFKVIFTTLGNMKTIFYGLIMTLYSFFYMFSTLSMFLTGGKITMNAFDKIKDIPDKYVHINFNDFGSSFISCFSLTMVNNINIICRSLSYKCNDLYQAYFATFYFMSTIIILNLCQTLLLEMYLIIKSKKLI